MTTEPQVSPDEADSALAAELGSDRQYLCREPWQNYYILRRGVMPCCFGYKALGPMSEWRSAWNSPELQEIRSYLARGELSPYCLHSLSCPIVQRYQREHPDIAKTSPREGADDPSAATPPKRLAALHAVNQALGGLPGRIHGLLWGERRS